MESRAGFFPWLIFFVGIFAWKKSQVATSLRLQREAPRLWVGVSKKHVFFFVRPNFKHHGRTNLKFDGNKKVKHVCFFRGIQGWTLTLHTPQKEH